MTKPEPVCGALTHKKTPCQNTLVTGCGLCPVHASQLRAAKAGLKPRQRNRRKKQSPPDTHIPSLHEPSVTHTPLPTRPVQTSVLVDQSQFLCHITTTPMQRLDENDFCTPQQDLGCVPLRSDEVLDHVLKDDCLSHVSPVTPKTPEAQRTDLFEEGRVLTDACDPVLHHSPDNYFDFSSDIRVPSPPKFD